MKFNKQILYIATACLLLALFFLQGILLFQNHQATKEQLFIEFEEITIATIGKLDTIRVDKINAQFEKDLKYSGYITLDSTISETGRKLMVRDAKENFNLVEVHFPINPKTDKKSNLELLLSKNRDMLLEGSVMYWQQTLGERLNEYMEEPWNLGEVEQAVVQSVSQRYPKLEVGMIEKNPDLVWERSSGSVTKKRFRDNQSFTFGLNGLGLQAFSEMKFLVLMTCLIFILVGFSFCLMLNSWLKEFKLIRLKEEQLDHLAHEMLTPLSIINIALDRIKAKSEGEVDLGKYFHLAKSEVNRMKIFSKNILLKDRQNSAVRIDLADFLKKYKEQKWEGLELKVEDLDLSKHFILMDKDILEIVMHSLLDNAIKYGEKEIVTVELKIREDDKYIFLRISDNGAGISQEDSEKVFQKYYRSEKAKLSGKRGFGLGLYHVKNNLKSANAQIAILDSPIGAAFEIKFKKA